MEKPIDWTRPEDLRTRDGRRVVIYCTDASGDWPVHGRIEGNEYAHCWRSDGVSGLHFGANIIQLPRRGRIEGWVNVYGSPFVADYICPTKQEADSVAGDRRIACIHISQEYEEGEGL